MSEGGGTHPETPEALRKASGDPGADALGERRGEADAAADTMGKHRGAADVAAGAPLAKAADALFSESASNEVLPDEELLYDLADLFKVFGDTTRIKILYALMTKEMCVADLAETVGATQSAVSHQLRNLKQSRLVRAKRDGKNVIYSLADSHVYTMLDQGMTHICE